MSEGYNIYMGEGGDPGNIDYVTPVDSVGPGVATADVVAGLSYPGVYLFAIRAESAGGTEETNTDRIVRVELDAAGALVGPAPAAISWASAQPAAAGALAVNVRYHQGDAPGRAKSIKVAGQADSMPAAWDFDSPLATKTIDGNAIVAIDVAGPYTEGQHVYLAVQAFTSAGIGGDVYVLPPVVAVVDGPDGADWLEAVT